MKPLKLSNGLNFAKKPSASKPDPSKRKPIFGGDDSDDDAPNNTNAGAQAQAISSFDDMTSTPSSTSTSRIKSKPGPPTHPPKSKLGTSTPQFGDLSSALTSRKYADAASALDPSIYDYDASYDTFKAPAKANATSGAERKKAQYMSNVKKMAEVRERDRRIAEDRKMQREREAEGDEFADKEKFVTEAYKKQQEENRRLEEEEKRQEEMEAKGNRSGGMTGFYKDLLDREDQRQADIQRAAEELALKGPREGQEKAEEAPTRTDADLARAMNEKGADVAINDEGQVVDKRQLLRGGLNVGAKKKSEVQKEAAERKAAGSSGQDHGRGYFAGGSKQSMRDRQSRMLEAQYEQALKRSRDEEEEEQKKVESASKSRKTETDISSAKERYLARKRAAEEAKKNGTAEEP